MTPTRATPQRSKFRLLGLLALGLVGCAAGKRPATNELRLTGVLTRRGGQIDAWFGIRANDGQLWRLEPENTQIAEQMNQLLQQNVQLIGEAISSPMPPPVLRVTAVSAAK